jgi:hypothetical protein
MNFQRLYDYRFRNINQSDRESVWQELANYLHRQLDEPARLLDPAAGRGEFINAAPARERWAVDRVDYGDSLEPEITRVISDIFDADLPKSYFEGIFVSNFLEHLDGQEQVAEFLTKMCSVTAPGGRIAIMGPNFRYTTKEYFDMADHTVVLTHKAVAEHLYAAGYEVRRVTDRFLPYSFTGRLPAHPLLTRAYLNFSPGWRLLGKQFLVVAERSR